jgi:hypothetical protein
MRVDAMPLVCTVFHGHKCPRIMSSTVFEQQLQARAHKFTHCRCEQFGVVLFLDECAR